MGLQTESSSTGQMKPEVFKAQFTSTMTFFDSINELAAQTRKVKRRDIGKAVQQKNQKQRYHEEIRDETRTHYLLQQLISAPMTAIDAGNTTTHRFFIKGCQMQEVKKYSRAIMLYWQAIHFR